MNQNSRLIRVKKIAIVGVGLIGGSLGMACKKNGFQGEIIGYGRSEEKLRLAVDLGAIDSYQTDMSSGWEDVDLIILATPVGLISSFLKTIAPYLKKGAIVSDVGSTKENIIKAAEKILSSDKYFVGAHPIAGTEKSGVTAAFPELYKGAKCIITPTPQTNPQSLEVVKTLWQTVGSDVILMDAPAHDFTLAAVSHLPHIVAYSLVNTILDMENEQRPLISLSGGGFRDYTRIAASDPVMWRDICLANRDNLCKLIEVYQKQLEKIKILIKNEDFDNLLQEFQRAREGKLCGNKMPKEDIG